MAVDVECLEQSKDPRLRRFLVTALELLTAGELRYAAFGSCAAFAHGGKLGRLVRDLDIILPADDFERLEQIARSRGFEAQRGAEDFVRVAHDIFRLHAVPEIYQLFDYRTRARVATVDTGISRSLIERRELRFATGLAPLELAVVPAETLLMTLLLRPLNTQSIEDLSTVLGSADLSSSGVGEFARRNPALRVLLSQQLARLAELIEDQASSAVAVTLARIRAVCEEVERGAGCPG